MGLSCNVMSPNIEVVPEMEESENLYKLYGYGLWIRENTHPQYSLIRFGTTTLGT